MAQLAHMGDLPDAVDIVRELERPFARIPHATLALALLILPDAADAVQHTALIRTVRTHMLPCDGLGLLEGCYAWILPGATQRQALALINTVLDTCALPCTAGLAVRGGPDRSPLMGEALAALHQARSTGMRVYTHQGENADMRKTLVRAHEKRFLFSGGD